MFWPAQNSIGLMLRDEVESTWKCTNTVVVKTVITKAKTARLKEELQTSDALGKLALHFVDCYTFKIVNISLAKDIAPGMTNFKCCICIHYVLK